MDFKTYFLPMSAEARKEFADKCGASPGHLQNIAYGYKKAHAELAIAIEGESQGAVRVEELRPDVNWDVVRKQSGTEAKAA